MAKKPSQELVAGEAMLVAWILEHMKNSKRGRLPGEIIIDVEGITYIHVKAAGGDVIVTTGGDSNDSSAMKVVIANGPLSTLVLARIDEIEESARKESLKAILTSIGIDKNER